MLKSILVIEACRCGEIHGVFPSGGVAGTCQVPIGNPSQSMIESHGDNWGSPSLRDMETRFGLSTPD